MLFSAALGSLLVLIGTLSQMVLALQNGIRSLESFQADVNRVVQEERDRRYQQIPRWRLGKRRKVLKELIKESGDLLTREEKWASTSFDRQANGWAFLVVGSLIALVCTSVDWIAAVLAST